MKILAIMVLVLSLAASGCTLAEAPSPAYIEGLVHSVEGDRFLVVEGLEDPEIPYDEWSKKGLNAAWLTVTGETVIVDEKGSQLEIGAICRGGPVRVWVTGPVKESYPVQADAERVLILAPAGPVG
jgi:hypothetical protein